MRVYFPNQPQLYSELLNSPSLKKYTSTDAKKIIELAAIRLAGYPIHNTDIKSAVWSMARTHCPVLSFKNCDIADITELATNIILALTAISKI